MPMPLLLPFFQGLKPECAMGWDGGEGGWNFGGFSVREDFDFFGFIYWGAGEVTKKLKEKEKERKEEKVAWKIILIREKLKRDYEVERRIGMGTSRLSRHVYHVTFLFSL